MSPVAKPEHLLVFFTLISALLSFGADGATLKLLRKKRNSHHRVSEETEPSSYRLILDNEFKTSDNSIQPINNDSISPWTYTYSHDDNLYPPSIAEAKCSLTGCLMDGEEDLDYQSKPIYTQIMVLRRIQRDSRSTYSFRLEHKVIAVGCTCVRHHVVQM
ncbi:hypothetical protein DNTS_009570 [Danionella cerebrum]|uniref:Uncharacterized protein n=1 Tax=Danionella cerebrum TaxID=2873325 RepID=A0A553QPR0_9TELE|nr:hypothetical protein DNTS_009570 [Danionella translucida]